MHWLNTLYWNNPAIFWLALGSAAVAAVSIVADRRRQGRKQADAVGFMPWSAITMLSVLVAVMSTAMVLHGG